MRTPLNSVRRARNFRERRRLLLSKPAIHTGLFRKDNKLSELQVKMLRRRGINLTTKHTERDALKILKSKK